MNMNDLVRIKLLVCLLAMLTACAQQPSYQLTVSSEQIKAVQILDPMAPERNDGMMNTLDGNYGKNVMRKYQRSTYDMKTSRQMTQNQGQQSNR